MKPTLDNAARTWRALERFRAPLSKMKLEDFAEPEVLYQIGLPPSRIDIMTSVTGLDFDTAWPNRMTAAFGTVDAPVLGLEDMRTAKRAAGKGSPDIYCPAQFLRGDMNDRENRWWRFLIEAECAPADPRS